MKRVLIIDDATTVRLYHRKLLEELSFEVHEASNGLEGLEKALNHSFDLFIVDINMPQMDGYRFLEEVRKDSRVYDVPAIMVSTEDRYKDIDKAYASGANFYLIKPAKPDLMKTCVNLMTTRATT